MSWHFPHLNWLIDTGQSVTSIDGKKITILEFRFQPDDIVLSAWATHFRNHYCLDDDIDDLRRGIGCSRADYLRNIKFPDMNHKLGPSLRAGDFAEILIADYIEYRLNYWVPRTRYRDKTIRHESTKGSDTIGFKIIDPSINSEDDTLIIFETKTQFGSRSKESRLLEAVRDSKKDPTRKAESLNAIKQRLRNLGEKHQAARIERFQNSVDNPYKEVYGAAALYSTALYEPAFMAGFDAKDHPAYSNLFLLVIHGTDMMKLVNELYRRAADEA